MTEHFNRYHLKHFAGTVASCMGFDLPEPFAPPVDWAARILKARLGGTADRVVLYHADAVGMYIWQKYTQMFAAVYEHTSLNIPFSSTIMPVTPVAHASMYTGLLPKHHGISAYVRPKLSCSTLYDELIAQGKKIAVVCQDDSSFCRIFAERDMDYFVIEGGAREIQEKALELIREDKYDLISVHSYDYDTASHANGPESPAALEKLAEEVDGFDRICRELQKFREDHRILVSYSPDHGQHLVPGGSGDHGLLMAEDINVLHFFGTI